MVLQRHEFIAALRALLKGPVGTRSNFFPILTQSQQQLLPVTGAANDADQIVQQETRQ